VKPELEIIINEGKPPIIALKGHLTKETVQAFLDSVDPDTPFILDVKDLLSIDRHSIAVLAEITRFSDFILRNGSMGLKQMLYNAGVEFLRDLLGDRDE
jgi:hypothetical protein